MSIYPWLTLVAIVWLQAVNGTNTTFPAYSSALKSRLGFSQLYLNNLAVASDLGKFFGWCSGLALTHFPLWLVLIVGAAIGTFGYGVQFLFLTGKLSTVEYWQAFLLCMIAGNSICWINTVCYVAVMQKFQAEHGIVVSLTTSYSGISAKVYIAMAEVILGKTNNPNDKSIYLLLNSLVPLAAAIIVLPVLHDTKSVAGHEKKVGLSSMFFMAGLTGTYAVLTTTVPEFITIKQRIPMAILLGMIMSTCLVPLLLKVRLNIMSKSKVTTIEETKRSMEEAGEEGEMEERKGSEYGVWDLVRSLEFWLYFGVYGCGGTLGLVYANNLGQIAQSRGVSEAVLVSISSSFGFFGKLGSALLSAIASKREHVIKMTASLALLMVPMAISFFLLLIPSKFSLLVGTAMIAMSTGAITSLAVSITFELFGFKHFAINHNILVANIPIGSFLFGYIAARIYDKRGEEGHRVCNGVRCFHQTFLIWGFICSIGTILSFVLYYRTSRSHHEALSRPEYS